MKPNRADLLAALQRRPMTPKQLRQTLGIAHSDFQVLRDLLAELRADGLVTLNESTDIYTAAKGAEDMAQQKGMRSSADLREMLFDTIEKVRAGQMSANEAKAIANLSDQIVKSALAELEFARASKSGDVNISDVGRLPLALTDGRSS